MSKGVCAASVKTGSGGRSGSRRDGSGVNDEMGRGRGYQGRGSGRRGGAVSSSGGAPRGGSKGRSGTAGAGLRVAGAGSRPAVQPPGRAVGVGWWAGLW